MNPAEHQPLSKAASAFWRSRLIGAATALLLTATATGADYYVSTSGFDTAAGTQAAPWRTIQRAVNATVAGDTVRVRGGVYTERVSISGKTGTAALRITITSFTGEQAIVDQTGVTPPNGSSALLRIHNSNFITVRGIEFRNYETALDTKVPIGIWVTGACNGVRLEENKVHAIRQNNATPFNFDANAHGIGVFGTAAAPINNLVLDGNEVYDLSLGASEAVVLNGNVTNFQVVRNIVRDCNNIGIDFIGFEGVNSNVSLDQARDGLCAENEVYNIDTKFNPAYGGYLNGMFPMGEDPNDTRAAAGIYVDGGRNIIIERNEVRQCNFGIEVASEHAGRNATFITVRNNLLRANHVGGIFMGGADAVDNGGIANCSFTHNTVYQNDSEGYGGGQICIQQNVSSTVIRHNIIVCNPTADQFILFDAATSGSFADDAIDWNLYSGAPSSGMEFSWRGNPTSTFAAWQAGSDQDTNSVVAAAPGFVNEAGGDFNLQAGAAAANAGDPTFAAASGETDFGGGGRLANGRVDIGMDELGVAMPGTVEINLPPASTIDVDENAGPVQIPILRSGGADGTIGFSVTTTNGTAMAPSDYLVPTALRSLGNGVTTLSVPVTIVNSTTTEADETFTVTLSAPTGGATLGAVTSVTVRIIDIDSTAPGKPVISTPAANVTLERNSGVTVDITGTATDNKGVDSVKVKLNGGAFVDATLTAPGATSTGWSLAVLPASGANTLTVQSFDERGNASATVVRNFTVTRRLTVNASALGSVTAGYSPSSFRSVGQSLTITATPKPPAAGFDGALFTGWVIGGSDVANGGIPFIPARLGIVASALQKQTLTFHFREGLVLTAGFIDNPYTDLAGVYHGLIRPSATLPDRAPLGGAPGTEDGTAHTNATEGRFQATVQKTGAFSATLTIDGLALLFSGAFDASGDARFGTARLLTQTVARTGKPSLTVALHLASDKITGTVTSRAFQQSVITGVSVVDSDRAYFNGLTPATTVDSGYLGATSNVSGTFTVILPPKHVNDQTPGYAETDYPRGFGTATITVTKAGGITITGKLADGSLLSATSALSEGYTFPLFAPLYNKLGFLSGVVTLDKNEADSDLAGADLQWLRPFQGTSHYYPFGWPDPIKVDLLGAKYLVTVGQSVLRAPGGGVLPAADADGNAGLSLTEGQLSEDLGKRVNVGVTDAVARVPSNDPTFTLTIIRTTGAFSGILDHTDDTKPTFSGIIYQKGAHAGGYGYFLTKQPVPITYTGESGGVRLIGQ